ncbi:MAG: alcohol dehydrogenase catalytic domain-containing protein [Chloroflexi bacterium]|nr:alcohol dehydrogenase catalytic domain-containing protein [Ardenticatenaceae bacterium]MBL1127261.1 Zn-dependent alcohol dehydrogenase [Chloroflexota bacterium]NOG33322.1 alcohol dehydrogenase catalytic domain-containing protein [Chloroflexota bacterium]GIK56146.1 MAG: alcohol dehydrogenase [Chloroflexota bacterium]
MQALYLQSGQLAFQPHHPQPTPQSGEALIRVRLAGICTTDLEIVKGYVPGFQGVLGHEFVGEVIASSNEGAPDEKWHGRRVVGSINLGCGLCPVCLGHGPEHCPQRRVLGIIQKDGVFADFVTLPLANLLEVPPEVPDEAAVFTEPLAAALRIREQVVVRPTAHAAVVGPGRLGLLVGQVLALAGTAVTMLGRTPPSLELPARLGLHTGLAHDFADNSFDLVVEATGNAAGFAQALRLVRPLGTLIFKSTYAGDSRLNLTKLVVGEITVVGSRCGPFAPALRLLAQDAVNVGALIDAEYPLAEGLAAMAHAAQPGVRKVLLRP